MRTENGLKVDMDALNAVLMRADVLTIGFTLFPERLLIDTRTNDRQGQLVTMVEPVASVQERYLWLGRHRGAFGAPEAFSFFVWPLTVPTLIAKDVLKPMRSRLEPEANRQLDAGLEEAATREQTAIVAAVRGDETWPALWEREPRRPAGR